jgi:phage minor structural protein
MRVGYEDALGVFQVFEIRKVRTLEPDHLQDISAEHIAISELTDEFAAKAEWTNITASAALSPLLANTGWSIGTDTTSNTSSGDLNNGNVWNATRLIQQNWNVYILPRIVVGAAGITNKYLDIIPAEGTWRGFRISLDKNANEVGVIWDDSKLKTALYAFGQEKNKTPLTFADVVWTATADHPAKPSGQTYLEDPTATAAYGRNGRPRFGYYQNASITNATTLLEKTWETLKTVSVPDVTVNATVADLHRLGYVDVPLRLHDTALVEVRPTGVVLQKEIVQYAEDLLDPLQSRLTIGTYIPNIIYINRENARRGGGGGGSGGQTPLEYTTENNTVQISIDSRGLQSLCVGTGAQLNPDGSLVIDPDTGYPVFIDGGENMWSNITQNKTNITAEVTRATTQEGILSGRISVNADNIALKVSKGDVATQLTVEVGNVHVTGGNLTIDGYVLSSELATDIADISLVNVQDINATGDASIGGDLTVYGDLSVALANTLTCGAVACGNLDCDGISFGGGTTYTKVVTSWSISGNTLTLYSSDGTSENFSKAGSINVILKNSQTWKPAYFTHGGWDVSVTASGVNVSSYTDTVTVDGNDAWAAGWAEGYDDGEADGEAKFSTAMKASRYNSGNSIELFSKSGNFYFSAGTHVWYYQSTSGTQYYTKR